MAERIIAIDGPAGSGKSSVSKEVARRLGFAYLDTGAAYRAMGIWLSGKKISEEPDSQAALAEQLLAFAKNFIISTNPDAFQVLLDSKNITESIRTPEAAVASGRVAQYPAVRQALVQLFQEIIVSNPAEGIVVEGRDITTAVAPEAELKLFLTADEATRIARRAGENNPKTTGAESATGTARIASESKLDTSLKAQITDRDASDSPRLRAAETASGVRILDTTELSFEEVVETILDLYR